jgi:hypothetical protein
MIGSRHTFASYFALAVDTILKVLWREGYARGPQELVTLTYNRIRRLERRFNALVAQWRAGTLRATRAVRNDTSPRPSPQSGEGEGAVRARPAWPFPRGRAWIIRRLAPVNGPACVGTLCLAWEDPEMAEFFAAAPQVGRILRALAQMIGAPLPAWLKLPKRVRKPGLHRDAATASRLRDERSEMIVPNRRLPAREQAEDAMRRSDASGKAIDVRGFTAEANGWFMHWPRDGNCPPPKIGYAGRRRRPPKDYAPPKDEE